MGVEMEECIYLSFLLFGITIRNAIWFNSCENKNKFYPKQKQFLEMEETDSRDRDIRIVVRTKDVE